MVAREIEMEAAKLVRMYTQSQSILLSAEIALPAEGVHKVKKDGLIYPYLCSARISTQGIGTVVSSLDVPPITLEQAVVKFVNDLIRFERRVLELCPILAKHTERLAAIIDFTYNLGPGRLAASTLRRKINQEDWEGAKKELSKWVWGGGRKLPGLVIRRELEAKLL